MEAVRRKSPGVCIGWLIGVLAHFRLGWGHGTTERCNGSGAAQVARCLHWLAHRSARALPLGLGCTVQRNVAMEAVRRKSPGVCIGWLTGVLAHFRLGWVTGVLAHFRFG